MLVPGLICRDVLAPINLLGATPAFYPVTPQLCTNLGHGDVGLAKAVMAVNYFGFPQDLETFRRYCTRTGAALIEDNAHGFLSRDDKGRLLGSRGDAGVFSFRKTIAVPDGGALVLTGTRSMPAPTPDVFPVNTVSPRYQLKQAFRRVTGALGPRRTHQAIGAIRRVRQALTGEMLSVGPPDAETKIPGAPNPSALIARPLAVAEPELEARRRRGLYELAGRIVESIGGVPVFPRLPDNVVPYGFPIFATPAQASGIAASVGRYGVPLCQWPELPVAVELTAPEHYRHLFVLPFLW